MRRFLARRRASARSGTAASACRLYVTGMLVAARSRCARPCWHGRSRMQSPAPLGWLGIVRLGLVQTALGAIVVLTTSTLNRVMVVELALPAMLPGALVALHYARADAAAAPGPRLRRRRPAHAVDRRRHGRARGSAASRAAVATAMDGHGAGARASRSPSLAFALIGLGVGAAGTSLLVLLAKRVDARPARAGGDDRLDDDDRWASRSPPTVAGQAARSVLARRAWCAVTAGVSVAAVVRHAARGRAASRARAVATRRRAAGAARRPPFRAALRAGVGRARRRAASRSSSSCRCSRTARRT